MLNAFTVFNAVKVFRSVRIIRPIMQEFSWAWVYFISFSLITSFVIMNMIVGIVVDSIDAVHKDYQLRCNCEDGDEKSGMSELLKQVSELSAQVSRLEALCKKQAES